MSESTNSLAREPTRTTAARSIDTTTPIPDTPEAAAETVLRAFYAQDERDACLRAGDTTGAARAADAARDLMATAFVIEFPHLPRERAALAGVRFIEALFLQDEIENREALAEVDAAGELDTSLLLTDADPRDGPILADARWDLVESYLDDVCTHADIDPAYASAQTRFWKLHGQTMDWMDAAATAHRIKLEAMLDGSDATPGELTRLADYFVAGVAGHDTWDDDEVAAVDGIVGLVTTYYDELFALRTD
jgi:hypothetical protein